MRTDPDIQKPRETYPPQRILALIIAFLSVFGFFLKILFF